MRARLVSVCLVAIAIGAVLFVVGNRRTPSTGPVPVASSNPPDAGTVPSVAAPDAAPVVTAPPASHPLTPPALSARPPASHSKSAAPVVARKEARGEVFIPYLTAYIPAASLPEATAVIADMCDQEIEIKREASTHWGVDVGKQADEDDLGALHEAMEMRREARSKLMKLPGSTVDRKVWFTLVSSDDYKNACQPNMVTE